MQGLLSSDEGTAFESVVNELEEIGYMGIWFSCNLLEAGIPQSRERIFIIASYQSDAVHKFYTDGCQLFGDNSPRKASREGGQAGSHFSEEFISDGPLLVQRRGGFGFTKAQGYSPTIRAQTGGHQGGHTDRPILCGQKLDLERMRDAHGVPRGMDGRRGRFIGNAVAPPLVRVIGTRILEIEREEEFNAVQPLLVASSS